MLKRLNVLSFALLRYEIVMPVTNLRDATPCSLVVTAERFWGSVRHHWSVRHTAPADPSSAPLQQVGGVKVIRGKVHPATGHEGPGGD